jgi:putative transposase
MTTVNPYRGFRFSAEVIQHAVWLYHCFSLSLRDVETILAARGVVVSYESIRDWGVRFGRLFANRPRRRRPRPSDKWFMDEVFVRIHGRQHCFWRAVDQDGHVLDILVQSRRSAKAAKRFFRKLLRGLQHVPRVNVISPSPALSIHPQPDPQQLPIPPPSPRCRRLPCGS